MKRDFIAIAWDTAINPQRSISSALVGAFSLCTSIAAVANGNTSVAYVHGIWALGCGINLRRHFKGQTETLTPEDISTPILATLGVAGAVCVGTDVLLSHAHSAEKFISEVGLTAICGLIALQIKDRIWPKQTEQITIENKPY